VSDSERITHVESLIAHLQYDIDQLSRTVVEQQAEIAMLKGELRRFRSDFDQLPAPPRDPAAEKPPHY